MGFIQKLLGKDNNKELSLAKAQSILVEKPYNLAASIVVAHNLGDGGSLATAINVSLPSMARAESEEVLDAGDAAYLLGEYDAAKKCFDWVLQQVPGHAKALTSLGFYWRAMGEWEKAMDLFVEAGAVKNSPYGRSEIGLGILYQECGFYKEAHEFLLLGHLTDKMKNLWPESHIAQGYFHLTSEDKGKAKEEFLLAYKKNPRDPLVLYYLANLALESGAVIEAANGFALSLVGCPDLTGTNWRLIDIFSNDEASYKVATDQAVDIVLESKSAEAIYKLEVLASCANNLQLTKRIFDEVVKGDPERPGAYAVMGNSYLDNDEAEEAKEMYRIALGLDPNNFSANMGFGILYLKEGRYEASVISLKKALAEDPSSGDACEELVKAYEALGNFEEASRYRTRAEEIRREEEAEKAEDEDE